ncbi:MAG: threonine-phosphate decarboxylase [Sulfitobacter sp.]
MTTPQTTRDHGGGLDAAAAQFGGTRADWIDLSTGINPVPYPLPDFSPDAWTALPDQAALDALLTAARAFWNVPQGAQIIAAHGASALIARMPHIAPPGGYHIPAPTYNEHAAAFAATGLHRPAPATDAAASHVFVHPNNPDGRLWPAHQMQGHALTVIDESFCDVAPGHSHVALAASPGTVVLKSFGKFWGLAGLRLGFAIGTPETLAPLQAMLGPWSVSGPALETGRAALRDLAWADAARTRLTRDAARLDALILARGAQLVGGTSLFRLYDVADAATWQRDLAAHHIWSRIFPYNPRWLRLGLPRPDQFAQLESALS